MCLPISPHPSNLPGVNPYSKISTRAPGYHPGSKESVYFMVSLRPPEDAGIEPTLKTLKAIGLPLT